MRKSRDNRLLQHGITPAVYREQTAKGLRWCSGHKLFLSKELFCPVAPGKKRHSYCRLCHRIALLRKQGVPVTITWYEQKLATQKGRCAICSRSLPLKIDHDHETKEPRALLCDTCNRGLGFFAENSDLLIKASEYLRIHQ